MHKYIFFSFNFELGSLTLLLNFQFQTQENPFGHLTSFQTFSKNGLEVQLKCFRLANLQKDLVDWCFDLLKRNMKHMYEFYLK